MLSPDARFRPLSRGSGFPETIRRGNPKALGWARHALGDSGRGVPVPDTGGRWRLAEFEKVIEEKRNADSRLLRLYPSLGNSYYRRFWLGMLPAPLAYQMSLVAVPYAAFTLAGNATVLGLVSLALGVPMMTLSLVGGVVADRFPRHRILMGTQSLLFSVAVALAALSLSGRLEVWHLLVLSFLQGVAFAFNMPARQAYVAEIVGPSLLRSAVTLNNSGVNFSRVAGPALAGILLSMPFVGTGGVFATMVVMYAAVLVALFRLPANTRSSVRRNAAGGWQQMIEGVTYVRSSPIIIALLSMGFIVTFIGMPFQTLMAVFAERVFHAGAGGLGALTTCYGVGGFLGSLVVASLANASRPAMLQLCFGVGFGLALVAFALSPSLPVAMVFLVMVGFLSASYAAINNTLIMSNTDPSLHGRVMSIYLITFGSTPLGAMPLAWLTDQAGAPIAVTISGGLLAAAIATIALLYPAYRKIH